MQRLISLLWLLEDFNIISLANQNNIEPNQLTSHSGFTDKFRRTNKVCIPLNSVLVFVLMVLFCLFKPIFGSTCWPNITKHFPSVWTSFLAALAPSISIYSQCSMVLLSHFQFSLKNWGDAYFFSRSRGNWGRCARCSIYGRIFLHIYRTSRCITQGWPVCSTLINKTFPQWVVQVVVVGILLLVFAGTILVTSHSRTCCLICALQ